MQNGTGGRGSYVILRNSVVAKEKIDVRDRSDSVVETRHEVLLRLSDRVMINQCRASVACAWRRRRDLLAGAR